MLAVKNLVTAYKTAGKAVIAADDVSFEVPSGSLFTLLGPSGCGKTTTLRSIAGLERPVSGVIRAGDRVVYSSADNVFLAPNHRGFGMVFQSYAIWPHMTVFENAAFPLQEKRLSSKEIRNKVMALLETVSLDQFADRNATRLSGGQQQRLALVRALAMEPHLLLLDEPLSNLDAKLREKMRFELKKLQRTLDITTIYVTHDQAEALSLSHQIAVMNRGKIVQIGSPRDIYERPATTFVADFIGSTNFVSGSLRERKDGHLLIETKMGLLSVKSAIDAPVGKRISLAIRPENLYLSNKPIEEIGKNRFEAMVAAKSFLGETLELRLDINGAELLARAHPSLPSPVGKPLHIAIDPGMCTVLSDTA